MGRMFLTAVCLLLASCLSETGTNASVINGCGITDYNESANEFRFHCGLKGSDLSVVKNVENVGFKKKQLCDVHYSRNGQPEAFFCKEQPETIASFIAQGAPIEGGWVCTGLDGFGGRLRTNTSLLKLDGYGEFSLHIQAKKDTESVWFIKDSFINGEYELDVTNKLVLNPKEWKGELIESAGVDIRRAPKFMLVKPLVISVEMLTKTDMKGVSRWVGSEHNVYSYVKCSKLFDLSNK